MYSRSPLNGRAQRGVSTTVLLVLIVVVAIVAAAVTGLLMNIFERKQEAAVTYTKLVEVTEDTTDPAKWGVNWPKQYDSYLLTAQATRTRFGGHGGSEALPAEKIERDPWLKRMFLGYAFSIDYRDRRGHAFMLADQEQTERLTKPQTGSCLHCHASIMPLYRTLGGGDAAKGLAESYKFSYKDLSAKLHESGHAHPVSCVDCHDPKSMQLRVTRPGFIQGIQALATSEAAVPHLPSIERWRASSRAKPYDPNTDASRTEMRSYVCGQCHVEYYCSSQMPLTFPWGKGLRAGDQEKFWNEVKFSSGERFFDYKHAETGAPILKAQHPEFELWSQGVHARSGVSCADCHMPYVREGAMKVSSHWVRSPLLQINSSCQPCHNIPEPELLARVNQIQDRTRALLDRGGVATTEMLDAIRDAQAAGATPEQLAPILELQRKSSWRLDFVSSENSMGFHADQESARILAEALDYARQAQAAAIALRAPVAQPSTRPVTDVIGVTPNAPPGPK